MSPRLTGIRSNVSDDALEDKAINIFHSLNVNVNKNDIEDCHMIGKVSSEELYHCTILLIVTFVMKL